MEKAAEPQRKEVIATTGSTSLGGTFTGPRKNGPFFGPDTFEKDRCLNL